MPVGVPLAYGTNVHPARTAADIAAVLALTADRIRRDVGWDRLGVDLHLGIDALVDDLTPVRRALDRHGLSAHTLNGFPLLPFQIARVKDDAYRPDWADPERERWTRALLDAALLLSDDRMVTISTVPGGWRPHHQRSLDRDLAAGLGRWAAAALRVADHTGRRVVLAPEPEPGCGLETTWDAVRFWTGPLAEDGLAAAAAALDGDHTAARRALTQHLGLCVDACHLAVMGEEPEPALARLAAAGVPVVKCQASACPEADGRDPAQVAALAAMAEPRFLHQTVATSAAGSAWFVADLDRLPTALARIPDPVRLRTHFHIPLHREPAGPLRSTRDHTAATVAACRAAGCEHVAVETYTWSILGDGTGLESGTAAELRWLADHDPEFRCDPCSP